MGYECPIYRPHRGRLMFALRARLCAFAPALCGFRPRPGALLIIGAIPAQAAGGMGQQGHRCAQLCVLVLIMTFTFLTSSHGSCILAPVYGSQSAPASLVLVYSTSRGSRELTRVASWSPPLSPTPTAPSPATPRAPSGAPYLSRPVCCAAWASPVAGSLVGGGGAAREVRGGRRRDARRCPAAPRSGGPKFGNPSAPPQRAAFVPRRY